MEQRAERTILILILILSSALGVLYSVVVPPFEASDELWHYPMVEYIAGNWALPVQDPANVGPWRQEGSQPPLYYVLAAIATFWIDTSDMAAARHLNPHVDNGIATPDGNINLAVHHPGQEAFPWRGTVLAVHLIRFLSVLMGTAAVTLTYLIVCEVFPDRPLLALGAAAVHAFTPMVVFISGAVNNDNLVIPLSSLALLMLLRISNLESKTNDQRSLVVRYACLGIVLGLAALTKTSSLPLTVLTALVVTVRAVRYRSWSEFFIGGFATLLPVLIIAGWWYVRNFLLYGDLFGLSAFTEILGTREVPAGLSQLWRERYSFAAGYWGNFGGLNVPMSAWTYTVLNSVAAVAMLGLVVGLVKRRVSNVKHQRTDGKARNLSFAICMLWGIGVVVAWSQWASTTWSSQGRLIFTALPVWSLLLVLGFAGWLPRRWAWWAVAALALLLLGLAVAAPFVWIGPAYALPEQLQDDQVAAIPHRLEANFGAKMRLLGYDLETEAVEPGEQVGVTLYWEALAPTDRDYTVFVHLLGEGELLVAQRDTFPGLGRLSTTWLEPGFRWADRYVLPVPDTAYTPDVAQIEVGLYDADSGGVRLPVLGPDGLVIGDQVRFGRVQVRARPGDAPNPISVNFGHRIELVGYDLDRRAVHPGETVTLILRWRGLRRMDVDYSVSAQFVDVAQHKAAQHDGPLGGATPTTTWEPGQMLADTYTLQVSQDVSSGVYDVRVVVYLFEEGEITRLPTVPAGGQMQANHITLTTMRVVP
ncbi:MAG: glycosyltransferase family 39 protein [Chloroflexota bacterium]|nr:glycosyltransferase family 39 protein [Chloroflexota bacterium]